ncbi:hypothetical protein [Neisseria meningitidis]|uniref:hypothetical protein n=1 Tax=Neisseria meningitidis TaxID=487 RepID=UPI0007666DF3|nr:hypothetical protein [Neisseria meningitidis]CWP17410.1 putative phage associated protein [Neisseria meningitidis]CWT05547.1 putative phage associated protein [Neisseria meningitidis]
MIESIEKPQESIRKNRNPHRVIPAKAGIQKRNATGIYRKKQKPHRRHSRKSWNPKTQRGRNLSEKTETPPTVIPAKAGIQKRNATGIYRKKQKPHRPSFPQKRESSNRKTTGIYQQKQKPPPTVIPAQAGIQKHNAAGLYRKKQKLHRPSFPQKLESKNATQQEFIGKNRNPTAVIPAKAGIQTRRHGILPDKTVSLDSTS